VKLPQLIIDHGELVDDFLHHSYLLDTQYGVRNAICVALSHGRNVGDGLDQNRNSALQSIRQVYGPDVPLIPDHNAPTDEDDQIRRLLGREFTAIVVDGTQQWPDKVLGAAAGAIRSPGCLFVLLPDSLNPAHQTATASTYGQHLMSVFRRHLLPIDNAPGLWSLHHGPLSHPSPAEAHSKEPWRAEQAELTSTLVRRCRRQQASLDLLLARRGRGKSSVLGQVLLALSQTQTLSNTVLTASHPNQVLTVQQHAMPAVAAFTPLDRAVQMSGDLVVVDEAGSVPVPVLKILVANFTHVLLAGTVDGYEGSGRALANRLTIASSSETTGTQCVQHHRLEHPVRWRAGDRLEPLVNEALRLGLTDSEPLSDQTRTQILDSIGHPTHERVLPEQLLSSEALLDEVFGLLLQAHYQTSSRDLRLLLDQPGITVWAQRVQGTLTAACLIAHEGDLDEATVLGIKQGTRRPAHQRLPMLLYRQSGVDEVLRQHHWRIVRIAVNPELHRLGLGTELLRFIQNQAARVGDPGQPNPAYLGASFGATPQGLSFWQQAGFSPIHYGYRLNPRSGQRAVAVAQAVHTVDSTKATIDTAYAHVVDSAKTLVTLRDASVPWVPTFFGDHGLTDPTLDLLASMFSAQSQTVDDTSRLTQWQDEFLHLHDVWGPILRFAGGTQNMAGWALPETRNTTKLSIAIRHCLGMA